MVFWIAASFVGLEFIRVVFIKAAFIKTTFIASIKTKHILPVAKNEQ